MESTVRHISKFISTYFSIWLFRMFTKPLLVMSFLHLLPKFASNVPAMGWGQYLHFILDYGITCTCCACCICCTEIFQYLSDNRAQIWGKWCLLAPFRKCFNNPRKDGQFGIVLVYFMRNTPQTLTFANVCQLFTSKWQHYHTQCSSNII